MNRPDFRWRSEWAFLQAWFAGSLLIPRSLHRALARPIARALELLLPGTAAAIRGNLRRALALPAGAPARRIEREVRRRARRALVNYGTTLFDHAWLTLGPRGRARELVRAIEGRERLDAALARGRGAVLATAHLGLWDLGATLLASHGYELSVVALAGGDARTNRYRDRPRRRLGIEILWVDPAAPSFSLIAPLRALREGRVVAVLADRATGGGTERVLFFGHPVELPAGPVALARAAGAPLLPAFVVLDERTLSYRCAIEEPVEVPRTADRRRDVAEGTTALGRVLERWVRAYPEQWYDFYDFWKGLRASGGA